MTGQAALAPCCEHLSSVITWEQLIHPCSALINHPAALSVQPLTTGINSLRQIFYGILSLLRVSKLYIYLLWRNLIHQYFRLAIDSRIEALGDGDGEVQPFFRVLAREERNLADPHTVLRK